MASTPVQNPLVTTLSAVVITLLLAGGILFGNTVLECLESEEGAGICLHTDLVKRGLIEAGSGEVVVLEVEPLSPSPNISVFNDVIGKRVLPQEASETKEPAIEALVPEADPPQIDIVAEPVNEYFPLPNSLVLVEISPEQDDELSVELMPEPQDKPQEDAPPQDDVVEMILAIEPVAIEPVASGHVSPETVLLAVQTPEDKIEKHTASEMPVQLEDDTLLPADEVLQNRGTSLSQDNNIQENSVAIQNQSLPPKDEGLNETAPVLENGMKTSVDAGPIAVAVIDPQEIIFDFILPLKQTVPATQSSPAIVDDVSSPVAELVSNPQGERFVSGKVIIIRPGDSLWSIAYQVYGNGRNYNAIYEANKNLISNPHWIFPGQVLELPRDIETAEVEARPLLE